MGTFSKFDLLHHRVKHNKWMWYFTWFSRISLAFGFFTAGMVKIMGERFASGLSANHPMGHYLEALSQTGYYYPFIGVLQVLAAVLLIIPRTATLGAMLYFPIILNICVLSLAVRFEGSLISSPLMVLANLYLLCWDYDKLKPMFSLRRSGGYSEIIRQNKMDFRFPMPFFIGVVTTIALLVLVLTNVYQVMPRNSLPDCKSQFRGTDKTEAGFNFCDCIHMQGKPLDECLKEYDEALNDTMRKKAQP